MQLAFTCKKLGRDEAKFTDYALVTEHWLVEGVTLGKLVYERDSHNQLHIHGTINVPKNFYRKKLNVYGYHIYFREIYDEAGWLSYISKHQKEA